MKSPTLSDIAALTGLTKSAVSLALRHDPRIPTVTRRRVEEAAVQLGYKRNAVVAHLMSELRKGGHGQGGGAGIALLNLNENPDAFHSHPTIPAYVQGCRLRAEALGYLLDEFPEPVIGMEGKRLLRILQARGLRGCILTGLMRSNRIPSPILPVISKLPCVITGVRTLEPQLPFACADHHAVAQLALAKALERGRRRPALVLDAEIDELVQGRFTAGFLIGQRELSARNRIPPFYHHGSSKTPSNSFVTWWNRYQPDAIISLFHTVEDWLKTMRDSIPEKTALIQLEVRQRRNEWAGVNQHNDRTGAAAVDLLIQMIHAGETALTAQPRAMLIEPSWEESVIFPQ
ncbi:MAG: LacI family DNA-binding transcriptional regulator [bacterium]